MWCTHLLLGSDHKRPLQLGQACGTTGRGQQGSWGVHNLAEARMRRCAAAVPAGLSAARGWATEPATWCRSSCMVSGLWRVCYVDVFCGENTEKCLIRERVGLFFARHTLPSKPQNRGWSMLPRRPLQRRIRLQPGLVSWLWAQNGSTARPRIFSSAQRAQPRTDTATLWSETPLLDLGLAAGEFMQAAEGQ